MNKKFSGKTGTSIKLITDKIKFEAKKKNPQIKRKAKNSYTKGKLSLNDWRNISIGLRLLPEITDKIFQSQNDQLSSGKEDVSKIKLEILNYKQVMDDFIRRILDGVNNEYGRRRNIEMLEDYSQIVQAARDGIILKQESRCEDVNGERKKIIYDTSLTPNEVIDTLMRYERSSEEIQFNKLNNYLGIGLGLAGMVGTLANVNKNKDKNENSKEGSIIAISTVLATALQLTRRIMRKSERESLWELRDKEHRLQRDLLDNEQISTAAEEGAIRSIESIMEEEKKLSTKIQNKNLLFDVSIDIAMALLSGMYIKNQVQMKENGKIDGQSLASALLQLKQARGNVGKLVKGIEGIQRGINNEQEFRELCKKVNEIISQMEEKVYPLEGAKKPFNQIEIQNLDGKFYPKRNYETGEIEYSTKIEIPEFSMKRGDVVLLSGESGTGKSTFLRLLKRGDINNRDCIKIDGGKHVDNLGDEYISFRPSINLGNESNVLFQITEKENISDLSEDEKERLIKILKELNLDSTNALEQLASKKFMEFSTGQQRRLALSKLFYRVDDGASVIIVDEPVGNVEDKLVRQQLELIKKYAESRNVMLLLVTHRLDLSEDLATKRYHINKDGVMEQLPVISKEYKGEEL